MDSDVKRELSASKMRLRTQSPYFNVLVSYLKPVQVADDDPRFDTAAVDGLRLYINRRFWLGLGPSVRDFVLVHEVLHCALGHCSKSRVGMRNHVRWNIAADYVVNLIAKKAGFKVPSWVFIDEKYDKMTVEEVYELLPEGIEMGKNPRDVYAGSGPDVEKDSLWRSAKAQAKTASKMFASDPLGDYLSITLEQSTVDWRRVLWRELTEFDADFKEWDSRLLSDEVFVEDLEPHVFAFATAAICVDTSGSTFAVLGKFCGEVKAVAELYHNKVDLYFADAALLGPFGIEEIEKPRGGGGTSFIPFFEEATKRKYKRVIYLTDLEGSFPKDEPDMKVTWVVPPGTSIEPPFGSVVKILN